MSKKDVVPVNNVNISKIIYFDEGSVTDYIQIVRGGKLTKTTQLLNTDSSNGNAGVGGEVSIGIGSLFKNLIGLNTNAKVKSDVNISFNSDNLVKTILENTILTDFLDIIKDDNLGIKVFNNVKITVIKDSLSYIIMISPYMKMLKEGSLNINSDLDLSLDIIKMDESIKLAKGYYEFECVNDDETCILRFNIESFKNNYKISDLLKMNLSVCAVPVGKINRENISIISEINAANSSSESVFDNPEYGEDAKSKEEEFLEIYDVLLAGVPQIEK